MDDSTNPETCPPSTSCAVNGHEEVLEVICHAIGHQLEDLARRRSSGQVSESAFIAAVLKIEAEEIAPHKLTLIASNTIDDWTVFKVKKTGGEGFCAAFEFLPETGEFRRVGSRS